MLNAAGNVDITVRVLDQTKAGARSAANSVRQFGNTATKAADQSRVAFSGAFPSLLIVGMIQQATRALAQFVVPAVKFQDSIQRMRAFADIGDDFDNMDGFQKVAISSMRALGREVGLVTPELLDALTEMSKKGIQGAESLKAMVPAARMAKIAGVELSETVDLASTLYHVWGFRNKELQVRMGQLSYVTTKTRLDFQELRDSITRTTTGVLFAKPAWEDFLFLLGKTRNVAPTARIGATQLRVAFESLAVKSHLYSKALGVAIKNTGDSAVPFRHLSEILFDVTTRTKSTNDALEMITKTFKLAGKRGATPFIKVLDDARRTLVKFTKDGVVDMKAARKEFFAMREAIKGGAGELNRIWKDYKENNPKIQLDIARATMLQFTEAAGGLLLIGLIPLARGLAEILNAFRGLVAGTGELISSLGPLGSMLTGLAKASVAITIGLFAATGAFALAKAAGTLWKWVIATSLKPQIDHYNRLRGQTAALGETAVAANVAASSMRNLAAAQGAASTASIGGMIAGGSSKVVTGGAAAAVSKASIGRMAAMGTVLGAAGGWIPLAIGAIAMLIPALMSFFSEADGLDEIKSLERMGKANLSASQRHIRELRDAGDSLGAAILEAAGKLEKVLAEKPAVFDERLFGRAGIERTTGRVASRITDPKEREKFNIAAVPSGRIIAEILEKSKALKVGETLSQEDMLLWKNAAITFSQAITQWSGGDKGLVSLAKEYAEPWKNLAKLAEKGSTFTDVLGALTGEIGSEAEMEAIIRGRSKSQYGYNPALQQSGQLHPGAALSSGFEPKASYGERFEDVWGGKSLTAGWDVMGQSIGSFFEGIGKLDFQQHKRANEESRRKLIEKRQIDAKTKKLEQRAKASANALSGINSKLAGTLRVSYTNFEETHESAHKSSSEGNEGFSNV